jgi:hypothetical protein
VSGFTNPSESSKLRRADLIRPILGGTGRPSVAVPEGARVAEMQRAIGALREVPHYAMELFVEGKEEPPEKRLVSAEKVPLFMLPKPVSDRLALEGLFTSCGGGADWQRKGG